jgi:lysophospholipase L1-like esterase
MKNPLPAFFRSALLSVVLCTTALAAGNTAATSAPRELAKPGAGIDAKWMTRHETFLADAKAHADAQVVFLGDSITDFWRQDNPQRGGLAVWNKNFAPLNALNLGISADRTQHVLWRLENGEVAGLNPKAVVLMIGTNNTGMEPDKVTPRNTPAETIEGVTAIVKSLRARLPKAKILLLAIFPRGEKPDHPQRAQINEINAALAKLDDGKMIKYLDIGPKFLQADGTLTKEIMPDLLHPGEQGYEIWAAAIKDPLAALMK